MISAKQWERVQSYIVLGQQEGARILAGGEGRPDGLSRGGFIRPTLLGEIENGMRIAREEIFGPVHCVLSYRDKAHAATIANDTDYYDLDEAAAYLRIEPERIVSLAKAEGIGTNFGGLIRFNEEDVRALWDHAKSQSQNIGPPARQRSNWKRGWLQRRRDWGRRGCGCVHIMARLEARHHSWAGLATLRPHLQQGAFSAFGRGHTTPLGIRTGWKASGGEAAPELPGHVSPLK